MEYRDFEKINGRNLIFMFRKKRQKQKKDKKNCKNVLLQLVRKYHKIFRKKVASMLTCNKCEF